MHIAAREFASMARPLLRMVIVVVVVVMVVVGELVHLLLVL